MFKFLGVAMAMVTIFSGLSNSIGTDLLTATAIIYIDGQEYQVDQNFVEELEKLLLDSYTSPALGICMDSQVQEERQAGVWIEWTFSNTHSYNDLPYDKLMINIQPDYFGFNILRNYKGKYEGRCIYLNLSHNSSDFYEYIMSTYK